MVKRAEQKLDPCDEPGCRYAKTGSCKFGLRKFGCWLDNDNRMINSAKALAKDVERLRDE